MSTAGHALILANVSPSAFHEKVVARRSSSKKTIPALTIESQLKRDIRRHLTKLGFLKGCDGRLIAPTADKDCYRNLHLSQREERILGEQDFLESATPQLLNFFAHGAEVQPEDIEAVLDPVLPGTWKSDLFRLASLTWSVPVSRGFGRRMRFLVWDAKINKLMGIIGLTDPVFNLKARDQWIGWKSEDRKNRLVNVMDAFVLGAVPPYNMLLCGKLVSSLIRTEDVRAIFHSRYHTQRGIISGTLKQAQLAMLTTSSSLGRSSVYNRLTLHGQKYFERIGNTSGWGHFHLPASIFSKMRLMLEQQNHKYHSNNRFGDGPSWKMRAIRQSLTLIGLNPDLLRHGLAREVYAIPLAANTKEFLLGKESSPQYSNLLSVEEVGRLAKERWVVPRAKRDPRYLAWRNEGIVGLLCPCVSDLVSVTA